MNSNKTEIQTNVKGFHLDLNLISVMKNLVLGTISPTKSYLLRLVSRRAKGIVWEKTVMLLKLGTSSPSQVPHGKEGWEEGHQPFLKY